MTASAVTNDIFRQRRKRLADAFGVGSVVVVPSGQHAIRNHDVEHEWRQNSDFWYLTGFDEPDCVLVLKPGQADGEAVLFVRPRDPTQETWHGRRAGVERAAARVGVDRAEDIGKLDELLGKLLEGTSQVVWPVGRDAAFDQRIFAAARRHRTLPRLHLDGPDHFVDVALVLSAHRLFKSAEELNWMRQAGQVTAHAHHEAMRVCHPGIGEGQLQAAVEYVFRSAGSPRVGYGSIVARGDNATILHYRENAEIVRDGDLVLIDAGAEVGYLTADVTRTWPANGRFTDAQRAVYAIVLDAEKRCIAACVEGATILGIHELAVQIVTQGMIDLGLLTGDLATLIKDETYKKYYMHRTSHWLGMDVHDTGAYHESAPSGNTSRKLQAGMVLTVEPGMYVPLDDEAAPEHLRGIGIRIEDDILVTDGEPEILTLACVKEIADIEAMVGTGGRWVKPVGAF